MDSDAPKNLNSHVKSNANGCSSMVARHTANVNSARVSDLAFADTIEFEVANEAVMKFTYLDDEAAQDILNFHLPFLLS